MGTDVAAKCWNSRFCEQGQAFSCAYECEESYPGTCRRVAVRIIFALFLHENIFTHMYAVLAAYASFSYPERSYVRREDLKMSQKKLAPALCACLSWCGFQAWSFLGLAPRSVLAVVNPVCSIVPST